MASYFVDQTLWDTLVGLMPTGWTPGYETETPGQYRVDAYGRLFPMDQEAAIVAGLGQTGTIDDALLASGAIDVTSKHARILRYYTFEPGQDYDHVDVTKIIWTKQLTVKPPKVVVLKPAGEYREFHVLDPANDDLMVRERVAYSRDARNGALFRWTKREWYAEDGTVVAVKWSYKDYQNDIHAQDDEANTRRQHVLATIILTTEYALVQAAPTLIGQGIIPGVDVQAEITDLGVAYIDKYSQAITLFKRTGYLDGMRASVADNTVDTEPWLDIDLGGGVTPRQMILGSLIMVHEVPDETWTAEILAGPQ